MTWLTPMYAIIAAAIAVPTLIILYFLKLRRRDLEVSTTLLWKKSIQDLQANAPFQKLRKNLLLFLQLLALAGIIGALGQLTMKGQNVVGNKHVILIDRSASMAALDETDGRAGTMTRLDAAKKQATALVDSLGEGNMFNRSTADEAMVISFAGSSDVRQQFTNDKAALKAAIESIQISEGPTSVEEAMRLALAHKPKRIVEDKAITGLTGGTPVTMHLYTDGRLPDADKARSDPDDTVIYHHLGRNDAANVGITGLRSERNYDDPSKLSIFIGLQNCGTQERVVDVEMLIDGAVAGIRSARVPAASTADLSASAAAQADAREREAARAAGAPEPAAPDKPSEKPAEPKATPGVGGVVFQLERGGGAMVQVRLRSSGTGEPLDNDVLATDDRAWLVVPPARKMAVAIVGRQDLFISSALSGLPLSRLDPKTPAEFEQLAQQNRLGEYDVIILNGWVPTTNAAANAPPTPPPSAATPTAATTDAAKLAPQGPQLTTALPPGRYLMLGVVPPGLGITDKGPGPAAAVVDWNREHPALRVANISSVNIATSRLVEVNRELGAETLATADNGPMVIEVTSNDLRSIVVPFDVADSDWPFKPSFVLFLASSINYLGEDVFNTAGRMLLPGRELADRLPIGAKNISVKPPGGDAQPLTAAADGRVVYGPIEKTGVYDVTWEGPAGPTDLQDGSGRVLRSYVCNMLDANESDLAAAKTIVLANDEVKQETKRSAEADKRLWPWFLLAALGVVMFEWFIYNRKVYL